MTTNTPLKPHPPEKQCAKLKKPFARRKRRGFISIDFMFVLGMIILGTVSVIALGSTMQKSWRATQLTTQITQIVGGLQRAYASSPLYDTGPLIDVLDGGGDIPPAARGPAPSGGKVTIVTPYGGAVTVVGAANRKTATVTINDLPQEACNRFLEGFVGLSVKNTDMISVTVGSNKQTLPLTRAKISLACTSTETDNDVAIVY